MSRSLFYLDLAEVATAATDKVDFDGHTYIPANGEGPSVPLCYKLLKLHKPVASLDLLYNTVLSNTQVVK